MDFHIAIFTCTWVAMQYIILYWDRCVNVSATYIVNIQLHIYKYVHIPMVHNKLAEPATFMISTKCCMRTSILCYIKTLTIFLLSFFTNYTKIQMFVFHYRQRASL